MNCWISNFFKKSHLLPANDWKYICASATILEQDERGIKVARLASGEIIKVFRVKRLISGANLYSYARRFCRNAERLHQLGIPTVTIKHLYKLNRNETAVLYQPIAGDTLRQIARDGRYDDTLAERCGGFLAELHHKGVHFHSLHTGNIVVMPSGALGLIDISDLTIYPWPLFCNTRARSFRRFCRYPEDIHQLGFVFWHKMLNSYFQTNQLNKRCEAVINKTIANIGLF
jgi:hypothetical protein